MNFKNNENISLLTVMIFAALFITLGSFRPFFFDIDEPKYVTASLEMLKYSDFLHPFFGGIPRMEKPPLTYLIVTILPYLFHKNASGFELLYLCRISAIIFSLLSIFGTYLIGKKICSTKTGFYAALLLTIAPAFKFETLMVKVDVYFLAFTIYASYFFINLLHHKKRKNLMLASFFTSMAVLTKGPFGLAPYAAFALSKLFVEFKNNQKILCKNLIIDQIKTGLTVFAIGCLPFLMWIFWASNGPIDYLNGMFVDVAKNTVIKGVWWKYYLTSIGFYTAEVLLLFLPFGLLFIGGSYHFIKNKNLNLNDKAYTYIYIAIFFIMGITVFKLRAHRYFLPALPFVAIVIANYILHAKRSFTFKVNYFAATILCLVTTIAIAYLVFKYTHVTTNLWDIAPINNSHFDIDIFSGVIVFAGLSIFCFSILFLHRPRSFMSISVLLLASSYLFYMNIAPQRNFNNYWPSEPIGLTISKEIHKLNCIKKCKDTILICSKKRINNNPDLYFYIENVTPSKHKTIVVAIKYSGSDFLKAVKNPKCLPKIIAKSYKNGDAYPLCNEVLQMNNPQVVVIDYTSNENRLANIFRSDPQISRVKIKRIHGSSVKWKKREISLFSFQKKSLVN